MLSDIEQEFAETAEILEQLSEEMLEDGEDWFSKLVISLRAKLPVVYGLGDIGEVVAYRWRCQLNEYGKIIAISHSLPEMCHNEIVGWERMNEINPNAVVVLLQDETAYPRNLKRLEVIKQLLDGRNDYICVDARGHSRIARTLSMVFIGDILSIYLALADGFDPGAILTIDYLKNQLSN